MEKLILGINLFDAKLTLDINNRFLNIFLQNQIFQTTFSLEYFFKPTFLPEFYFFLMVYFPYSLFLEYFITQILGGKKRKKNTYFV